ncbi:unnamed protein product [Schistosoma margrebowiei]|uniref:GPR180/TMEM145 transmembrane domain-containing protein n=1 Tax=Schistosoma margrebowiei TaxID=48269 RepID=A0A3P7XJX2_9TREM|nr:unnamed protein product [Schistosoma margrebowiei]
MSLVACKRNLTTCKWETTAIPRHSNSSLSSSSTYSLLTVIYDIWLVNGEPKLQSFNQFEHHFSFETHGIAQMFFIFLSLYIILNITTHIKLTKNCSLHVCLYLTHLWLASLGTLLAAVHWGVFSFDGLGLGLISELGTVITQWADSVFLAVLLCTCQMGFSPQFPSIAFQSCDTSKALRPLTSKAFSTLPTGFLHLGKFSHKLYSYNPIQENIYARPSTNQEKSTSFWPYVILLVTLLVGVKTLLYIWAMFDRDPVIDFSVWNTVPGCLLLALRICLVFWILVVVGRRHFIAQICSESYNMDLCILGPNINTMQFAAGYLLWIVILPLVVFIGETSVSPLWRTKTISTHFWMKTWWVIVVQRSFILPFLSAFLPSPLCLDPVNHLMFIIFYTVVIIIIAFLFSVYLLNLCIINRSIQMLQKYDFLSVVFCIDTI